MEPRAHEINELLESWSRGDQGAIDKLVPLVSEDLRRLAHRYMADEQPGQTLQTTALVNEAYVRRWMRRTPIGGTGFISSRCALV